MLLFFGSAANAQSNTFPTSGNVGIGTVAPVSRLQVHSGFSTDCNTYSGQPALSLRWTTPPAPCTAYPGPTGTPPHAFQLYSAAATIGAPEVPTFIVNADGNTGIGREPSATHRFSVTGATLMGGSATVEGNLTVNTTAVVGSNATFRGNISMVRPVDNAVRLIQGYSASQGVFISANTGSGDGPAIELYGKDYDAFPERKGHISFSSYGSTGQGISFNNYDPATSSWRRTMTVTNDNRVYIGNYKPSGSYADYKLGVDGSIICKKAVVQNTSWADFVFQPDYRLPQLSEVESFIKDNGHLPGIPTEAEVLQNGVDVGEMNKLLLQKIEELTLYVIQLKKETEALKAKNK